MEIKSNLNTVIEQIKQKLSIQEIDKLVTTVSQAVYASNLKRIHTEGKNVAGQSIGKYSITPIYINPKHSPKKFQPQGKSGSKGSTGTFSIKTKKEVKSGAYFKNGKPRHTRYFDTGYYGFRRLIGRDFSRVNLQLSGSLLANFQLKPTPLGAEIGFISNKKKLIAEGLEDHFNCKIWGVSDQDKTMIKSIVNNFVADVNNK